MPTLDWIGKGKVVNHRLGAPDRVLERQYSYDEAGLGKVVGSEGEAVPKYKRASRDEREYKCEYLDGLLLWRPLSRGGLYCCFMLRGSKNAWHVVLWG